MPEFQKEAILKKQKIGFVLLLLFGILTVALGTVQIRNGIYNQFARDPAKKEAAKLAYVDDEIRLQQLDTDQDGISDYEELSFYNTSPYLKDTDSDGKDDLTEIKGAQDPNCAEGKTCGAADALPSVSSLAPSPFFEDSIGALGGLSATATLDMAGLPKEVQVLLEDPSALRAILISTGKYSSAELSAVTDDELVTIFAKSIQEQQAAEAAQQSATTTVATPTAP